MIRAALLMVPATLLCMCCGDTTALGRSEVVYVLVEEDGQPVPTDPFAPGGCCITLSGSLTLSSNIYDLRTSHRNKGNDLLFDNSEQGAYARTGNSLSFTRTGGGGEGFPYLLGPGTISDDEDIVTLLYGDEGPGSNQIRATFRRSP